MELEIAVQDVAGARIAAAAGVDRIELCSALSVGGLTPSLGTFDAVATAIDPARIAVLVRPRGGGFVYDDAERDVVSRDIALFRERGAGAVVIGALTPQHTVDVATLHAWAAAAGAADVVFHRAIDVLADPLDALPVLRDAGVVRVLTSGGAARSIDGLDVLAALAAEAGPDLTVQAGGGVRVQDIAPIAARGITAVHLSARATSAEHAPSGPGGGDSGFDVTDPAIVQAAVAAVEQAGRR